MIAILKNRIARGTVYALVAASTVISTASAATPTSKAGSPRYDGTWSVLIVTEKGDCDRGYRYPIRITHGMLINGGSNPFTISGQVQPSGNITVTVSSGDKSATGTGRLAGNSGGGSWRGGACSGSWTAERRNTNASVD